MKKILIKAIVVSNKKYQDGTLIVERTVRRRHKKYHKIIVIKTRFAVQYDEKKEIALGSEILITQCSPYSKTKCHIVCGGDK